MSSKKRRRTSALLQSSTFEIKSLEQRMLMSSGQLFVGLGGSGPTGSVGEYSGTGTAVNASLISGITDPVAVAVSGTNLFVVNNNDVVSEYSTTGTLENASLISLPEVDGIVVSGTDIFVSDSTSGDIGEYTTSGTVVNAHLITDNNQPQALAVAGSDLFVVDAGTTSVGEYTLAGATVNATLITAGSDPTGLATSGSDLFLADGVSGSVAEYTTGGATVNASLITGLSSPRSISITGSNLYLADVGSNQIGQYTTAGATVNAALVSGLASPLSVFAVAPASKLVVHAAPTSGTAATALSPALVIHSEDANGNVDSLDTSNVTVAIASGPTGAVLGGTTTIALQNGTATFSDLTLSKSGGYTLTVTDGSLTTATTGLITVTAGTAAVLAFGQSPTGTTVGAVLSPAVTIDVEDAEGNIVTTDTSNVTMAIASGPSGAVLGGTTTVAAVSGVATFNNLTLSAAGAYVLAGSGSHPTVTSSSFSITAAAANMLAYSQQPASTTTTSVLAAVKVNIENSGGTLLTGDSSNVTLAIASGPSGATLGGTTTVAASGGIATFSNLTLTTAGTYTLIATDGSDTSTTSTSFVISVPGVNKLAFATQPQSTTTSTTLAAVKVNVENSSGTLLTGDGSTVTLAIASGPSGAVLGGSASEAAVGGVATFSNLSFATAGTYTLTASDGSDTSATSTSFVISVPGVNKLVFATQPSNTTTSTALAAVKVSVENSSGTLLTGDGSTVTLAIASGPAGAVLGGTASVAAVAGVATFSNLSFATAGTYTLTATDGSDTAATSTSFVISAPGVNQLAFATQPLSTTTATTLSAVKVNVENSTGTLLTGDGSTVTLAIASGPAGAVLGGTASVAAVGGVATFSNLSFTTAGTYTLVATDGSDTSSTSTSFTISAPGVNKLAFATQPLGTTTSAILAAVKVNVENSAGALLTVDGSTVTLAIATGPTGAVLGGTTTVTAVGGVATFSTLSLITPGSYTLTATDGSDTSATSISFTISVPGVNQLAFAVQPHSATTSATLPAVTVNVQNSSGTLLTGDGSTVTLSIASGPAGALLGGTVSVAAVGGVATFNNLNFATAGVYTLTATDGTDTSATSLSFTISPPLANKLVFAVQPVNATTTTGIGTLSIDVESNAGTLLSGDNSDVTLTIASGTAGATLGGTTTVAAVNGVATFSNLFVTTPGTDYTLTASDGTDVPATSSAFTITATPVPNNLVFVGEPVNTNTSSTLGSVTVDVENSGTLVTTDTGNVTLSITGNPAGVVLGGTTTVAAVNGVATFSNLTINALGNFTLTATEAGVTSAGSTAFNVYYPPVTVGQLDPTFGTAGLITSNVGFTSTAGTADDFGQVVVIGTTGTAPTESFSIARYNANGMLDTAFGTSGVATLHFAGTDDVPSAVSVLPGGQILIAGTATTYVAGTPSTSQFAITELNANGTLDTNFGTGTGEVQFGFSSAGTHDVLTSMVVSSKGIIYLGGRSDSRSTTGNDFALLALNPTGTADASFGAGGQVLVDFDNASDTVNSLALQTNGDLIATGSATIGGVVEIGLARLLPTGVLDRHFGTAGLVTSSIGGIFDSATSVAIQHNGEIVIGGLTAAITGETSTTDFVVARYTSAGRLDRSFGSGGTAVTTFSGPSAVTQIMIQANGRIVAVGKIAESLTNIDSAPLEVALARYTTRGVLDTAFDGSGTAAVDLNSATFTTSASPVVTAAILVTEADELIASKQGSAVLNANSEILAVGNTGANTTEAEVITQGVDLTATVLTALPTGIAGGTKSFANVQITEIAPDTAKGTITITLELTTDAQGNGATVVRTLIQKINLLGAHSHTFRIPFTYPTDLPTGNYYLQATVAGDGTEGMRELNQLNNLSLAGHAVKITPPFITLAGSALATESTFTTNKVARVEFTLTNDGNVLAKGKTVVDIYLSTDSTAADGTLMYDKPFALALKPGANRTYNEIFLIPKKMAKGTYTLIAVVDPLKSLGSIDQTSSTAIDSSRVVVG